MMVIQMVIAFRCDASHTDAIVVSVLLVVGVIGGADNIMITSFKIIDFSYTHDFFSTSGDHVLGMSATPHLKSIVYEATKKVIIFSSFFFLNSLTC